MAAVYEAHKNLLCKGNSDNYCPLCAGSGGGRLTLRQINAEEALYVCENPACYYPVGYEITLVRKQVPALLGEQGDKKRKGNVSKKEAHTTNSKDHLNLDPTLVWINMIYIIYIPDIAMV